MAGARDHLVEGVVTRGIDRADKGMRLHVIDPLSDLFCSFTSIKDVNFRGPRPDHVFGSDPSKPLRLDLKRAIVALITPCMTKPCDLEALVLSIQDDFEGG